jgi:catechol 2,3-dioxygenase-like lactoylglutathione lyase family enzyme
MGLSEMYHVGIVVPDVDAARERLTELLGIAWGPVVETKVQVQDGQGLPSDVQLKMCYSTEAPYLELIEERAGSPWVCNPHSNLHHIGYFSDSLGADSEGLRAAGCPLDITRRDDAADQTGWVYHRDTLGIRFELVASADRPMMEQYLFFPPASSSS